VIAAEKPDSLQALADRTGRAKSNLSRTLKTMERYGLVRLERLGGRTIAPRATVDRISVDLAFQTAA
jgi:predicted transcriptional regulator